MYKKYGLMAIVVLLGSCVANVAPVMSQEEPAQQATLMFSVTDLQSGARIHYACAAVSYVPPSSNNKSVPSFTTQEINTNVRISD